MASAFARVRPWAQCLLRTPRCANIQTARSIYVGGLHKNIGYATRSICTGRSLQYGVQVTGASSSCNRFRNMLDLCRYSSASSQPVLEQEVNQQSEYHHFLFSCVYAWSSKCICQNVLLFCCVFVSAPPRCLRAWLHIMSGILTRLKLLSIKLATSSK